jgi:hypothetical protein
LSVNLIAHPIYVSSKSDLSVRRVASSTPCVEDYLKNRICCTAERLTIHYRSIFQN